MALEMKASAGVPIRTAQHAPDRRRGPAEERADWSEPEGAWKILLFHAVGRFRAPSSCAKRTRRISEIVRHLGAAGHLESTRSALGLPERLRTGLPSGAGSHSSSDRLSLWRVCDSARADECWRHARFARPSAACRRTLARSRPRERAKRVVVQGVLASDLKRIRARAFFRCGVCPPRALELPQAGWHLSGPLRRQSAAGELESAACVVGSISLGRAEMPEGRLRVRPGARAGNIPEHERGAATLRSTGKTRQPPAEDSCSELPATANPA